MLNVAQRTWAPARSQWRMSMQRLLPVLTLLSALIAIIALGGLGLPVALGFAAKPLTTVLIIVYAWRRGTASASMRRLILAGLALSLAGDVFLLWPQQGFLPGLVSFLLAHLCYIAAFSLPLRFARRWLPFAVYAVLAGLVLGALWPGIPAALRPPVIVYVLCLAAMAAQAATWWRSAPGHAQARWAALGGLLFLCSDSLLAIDKFAVPLPAASLWILATYWMAQSLIASSLAPAAAPR